MPEQGLDDDQAALQKGMHDKAEEFQQEGAEIYRDV